MVPSSARAFDDQDDYPRLTLSARLGDHSDRASGLFTSSALDRAVRSVPPPTRGPGSSRVALYGLGAGFDLASTEWSMAQSPVVAEGNPLLGTRGLRVSAKLVEVGALYWIDGKLSRRHPKWARIGRWAYFGSRVLVAYLNVRTGQRERAALAAR